MLEGLLNFDALATIDVVLAGLFLAGIIRLRILSRISSDPTKAFAQLEQSIGKAYPELPIGYTFREVLERVKHEEVKLDWPRLYGALEGYERSRYGGEKGGQDDNREVLRLARTLNRRKKWWNP